MKLRSKDIIEIIAAFVLAWIFYQGIGFATGTSMPIVSVVSDSMLPVLHRGDLLFVGNAKDVEIGDIVIFNVKNRPFTIVHRIIKINDDGTYETKGDHNRGQAPYEHKIKPECPESGELTYSCVVGKVLFGAPLLGYPRLIIHDVVGI